jgi:hypothetical protein
MVVLAVLAVCCVVECVPVVQELCTTDKYRLSVSTGLLVKATLVAAWQVLCQFRRARTCSSGACLLYVSEKQRWH